jgi:hypothetical protein
MDCVNDILEIETAIYEKMKKKNNMFVMILNVTDISNKKHIITYLKSRYGINNVEFEQRDQEQEKQYCNIYFTQGIIKAECGTCDTKYALSVNENKYLPNNHSIRRCDFNHGYSDIPKLKSMFSQ